MAYNSEIYKEAYDKLALRREKSAAEAELRRDEIKNKFPEYNELKKQMVLLMGECFKNLDNPEVDITSIKKKISENIGRQKELLISNGYPQDYTEEKHYCEKCSDKGYVGSNRCECLNEILRETAAMKSNLNSVLTGDNFSNFSFKVFSNEKNEDGISPRENMKRIIAAVKDFIDNFKDAKTRSLLFIGKSGVGKTFLASCIAEKLLDEGFDVYYQSAGKITEMCEAFRFRRNTSEEISDDIERLYETDLLIIDDLGCEFTNSYTVSILYEIINKRIMYKKKTLITTNYSLKELNNVYTERLFSRFVGEYDIFEFIGDDIRVKRNI